MSNLKFVKSSLKRLGNLFKFSLETLAEYSIQKGVQGAVGIVKWFWDVMSIFVKGGETFTPAICHGKI